MKRVLLACLGAFCLLTAGAFADEGLPSMSVLDDMGLSGMQIITDNDAMAVRGKGWLPDVPHSPNGDATKPWVIAGGASMAGFKHEEDGWGYKAGSMNFYLAEGKYKAGGENFSYATKSSKYVTKRVVDGWVEINSRSITKTISAGGYSAGHAF